MNLDDFAQRLLGWLMEIYLGRNGQREGPFSLEQVRARLATGEALPGDLAWYEGASSWMALADLPGLNAPSAAAAGTPPPLAPPPLPAQSVYYPAAPPQETYAVVSLILGLVGLVMVPLIPSIPAIIFGHLGLGRIKRSGGQLGGRGLAIAGLVIGYLTIAIWTIVALSLGFVFMEIAKNPTFRSKFSNEQVVSAEAILAAQRIAMACEAYAQDHEKNYPPTLEALVPKYLPDQSLLQTRVGGPSSRTGFEYFGGKSTDPNTQILFQSWGKTFDDEKVVARVGGGVVLEDPDLLPVAPESKELEIPSKEP